MRVHLIRHSVREVPEDFTEDQEGDPEAELTPEGAEIADGLGQWMAEHDEVPSVIFVSATVRAHQTAERVAKAMKAGGFAAPEIVEDVGIGPGQSVRSLILKAGADGLKDVAIVSHRASIVSGLKALNVDNEDDSKVDAPAMGELRTLKVKRKSGRWQESNRVRPSDLGHSDNY